MIIENYRDAFTGLNPSGMKSEVAVDSNTVASQLRYEMTSRNVPLGNVSFLVAALDSIWMRDYGPIILKAPDGTRSVADMQYYPGRYDDDRFPAAYAAHRGWARTAVNISYEGGNFATDGRGQGFASRGVLRFNPGKTQAQVLAEFRKLGCDRVEFFEPLAQEGTTHIDMFARIMSDTQAIVSSYPANHRQYQITENAATQMRNLGYQVTRVPSAYPHDEYATYANSVLANGVALIPQYGDATRDRAALDAYRSLGFTPVGIDCRQLIRYGGATHCISMQIPR
jgi:agmatine deiminase